MIRTILVPFDGSDLAAKAFPVAAFLARRLRAKVALIAVHEPDQLLMGREGTMLYADRPEEPTRDALAAELSTARDAFADTYPDIDVSREVRHGKPADEITAFVEGSDVGLVVLSTHGRGGASRLWLGSVTEGLLRRLRVPVLVLPAHIDADAPQVEFTHALVPLDGSRHCEEIIDTVRVIADERMRYTFIHVAAPLHPVLRKLSSDEQFEADREEQRQRAEHYLREVVERHLGLGCDCRGIVKVSMERTRQIVETRADVGADFIALVTRGSGPLGRFFLGSVADKVLRAAEVPVLLQHVDVQ